MDPLRRDNKRGIKPKLDVDEYIGATRSRRFDTNLVTS